ncbi:aminotransferase class I/II-fold pyridoxal phosphate-dependent enzyme [Streptomyces sp. NPDC048506]|uniref:MalY/PatB family protein n=1 Tax=Streptomyces sp. NPDC048506 TaxID=3155028 RepID=UPI003427171F
MSARNAEAAAWTDPDSLDLAALSRRDGEKWSVAKDGVLPAWVADMDFPIAPSIRQAVLHRMDTDLGYPAWYDESEGGPLGAAFAHRAHRRHGFAADPAHVRLFTDINQAMQVVLQLGTAPGDGVALHTPVCPPFEDTIGKLGRVARTVPIRMRDGAWRLDVDHLRDTVTGRRGGPPCRALFLVNPHNPTGRVLRRRELLDIAALAVEHDLLVVSDEVHADLVYPGHQHIPFASLSDEVAERTVTLTSGSKTFNLAGIRCAVAHIGVKAVRDAVDDHQGLLFGQVSALAVDALKAAWTSADGWLDRVMTVLRHNRATVAEQLPPGVACVLPEATYLAWLDCRALDLGEEPSDFFAREARVLLMPGSLFGSEGAGFVRLNFATPPRILAELLRRIRGALGH